MKTAKKDESNIQELRNLLALAADASLIESSETYRKVRNHRKSCPKWKQRKACIDCMGGGLVCFTVEVVTELNRKYPPREEVTP